MTVHKRQNSIDSSDIDLEYKKQKLTVTQSAPKVDNLYLETVDRKRLDFDFEKVCSITLSNINIYGCLVCGKYFQGRGSSSPAFSHSIDEDHHVFINFNNLKAYILPENKIVDSPTLDDIRYAIYPTYTEEQLKALLTLRPTDLSGDRYSPGYVGLNNIKSNDYSNVILQSLSHVRSVRSFFLLGRSKDSVQKTELNKRLDVLIRKLWSPRLFKSHVSPQDLLQHISIISNKKYTIGRQSDPKDFLLWLLNELHQSFSSKDSKSTIFSKSFQGKLTVLSRKISKDDDGQIQINENVDRNSTRFWILTLDLPSRSLFKDGFGVYQIAQVKLLKLLEKFDGKSEIILPQETRRYEIEKFPPFLVFHFNRFKDTKLDIDLKVKERNQTLVDFPLTIEFKDGTIRYRLISNVIHESTSSDNLEDDDSSYWKIQLRKHDDSWVKIDNLTVTELEKEFLFLSESYIQIWERVL